VGLAQAQVSQLETGKLLPSDELRAARKEEVTRIQALLASLDQMSHQL
jgi:hypothetical protein